MFQKSAVAALLLVCAAPAMAQVTGGSLGVEYDFPTDGGDFGGTTYFGAIEYGITREFSVSLDLSGYRLDNISTDASSVTLHGVYHLDDMTSFGAFYGSDALDTSDRQNLFGLEAGTEFGEFEVEGYFGSLDGVSEDVTLLGANGRYGFADGFAALASFGMANGDDSDVTRYAIGAEYALPAGPEFYAELGTVEAEALGVTAEESFIGIGTRISFGAERGTTFDQRSIFEILPGF